MSRPNFFIVGAPKCGTSALHLYLREHPDVYLPRYKEPKFFARDLDSGSARDAQVFVRDSAAYVDLFAAAGDARCVGEASALYLYSSVAARAIAEFAPGARVIAMLRNPVDVMYAFHGERLYNGNEDIEDFAQALAAEAERRAGLRLPRKGSIPAALQYRAVVRFAEQLERYYECVGRDNVHVIIFDDFKRDPERCYRETLRFLGLSDSGPARFDVVNANKRHRSRTLGLLVRRPPLPVRKALRGVIGPAARRRVRRWLLKLNTERGVRPPLDPVLRRSLELELEPEVRRLGALLGRDLSHWTHGGRS